MNYFQKVAVSGGTGESKAGRMPNFSFRFLRLNYIQPTAGFADGLPNVALVKVESQFVKIHEGEVFDFGSVASRVVEYDLFANQLGATSGGYDFEFQLSVTKLADRYEGNQRRLFYDGASVTLTTLQVMNPLIKLPPNFAAVARQGRNVLPVMRHLRINNQSGGDLTISPTGSGVAGRIPTATIFDQDVRQQVVIRNNTGGSLTFDYQVFFEWI